MTFVLWLIQSTIYLWSFRILQKALSAVVISLKQELFFLYLSHADVLAAHPIYKKAEHQRKTNYQKISKPSI